MLPPTGPLAGLVPDSDIREPTTYLLKSNELCNLDREWLEDDQRLTLPYSVRDSRELAFCLWFCAKRVWKQACEEGNQTRFEDEAFANGSSSRCG